jgi:hypothetical protein
MEDNCRADQNSHRVVASKKKKKSSLGYNPVDIDIVSYILSNIIYMVLGES